MRDTNHITLMGRLTADVELRYTGGGKAVADLRIASNREWSTDGGDPRKETVYVDATVWNRLAELCAQYLKKGSKVQVEGRLGQESWEDRNTGDKRTKHKITAEEVVFLDPPKGDRDDAPPQRRGQWGNGNGDGNGHGGERRPPARQSAPSPIPGPGDDEEDIPFVDAYASEVEPLA